MKIAQVIPQLNAGGVERGVLDLVEYFKDSNEVSNIVISGGGRLMSELQKIKIAHYKLSVYKKSPVVFFLIPKVRKVIQRENIDIVHARSRVPAWISFFAARKSRAYFVTTAHGIYKSRFSSEVMGWGKFVICPSKVVARHTKETFGVPQDKIVVIPRWVNTAKFIFVPYSQRMTSNIIISVGRISPSKGYEYLIKAMKKVVRFNPYIELRIVGSPDSSKLKYFDYLKTLVKSSSLNYSVKFIPFCKDIEDIYKEARLLVAPSVIEESFGRVIIESFACGVPVIATRVGSYTEIIEEDKNGILVDPSDSEAIADNIIKIFSNSDWAANLAINGRRKVEEMYTMEKSLEKTKEVYQRTLNYKRILVIKISSLGDLILSLPSLKAIRQRFPEGKIYLLTLKKYFPLLYDCPFVDEIVTVSEKYKTFKSILHISRDLRRNSFDYIVDLQNNRASHLIAYLSFPKCSFGYSLRGGIILDKKVRYNRKDEPLKSQERILELLGIRLKEKKLVFWERKSPEEKLLFPQDSIVGINLSASLKWESKNWPQTNICRLIEMINKHLPSFRVALFGSEESAQEAQKLEAMFSPHPFNVCGKTTLKDLPLRLKQLKVFITPDTATLHLASALGIPTIALFGPTDPKRHVVESENLYVFHKRLPCSYCYSSKCKSKDKNRCMKEISPQEVFSKLKEIVTHLLHL